ncbi:transporter [Methylibium sp.]|uniref:MMPL family transporter n=1 Tax=Methylibium sp. TaxID=2067992 RepID=UPI00286D63DF|nr:transporter [Methylibium sp.]
MTGGAPHARSRRAPTLAVWLWLAAMLLGAALIGRARFTADLSAFLPAHPNAQQQVLIEQLQSGIAARTLLLGIEGGDATERAAASRALARALRASGLFEQVQNGDRSGDAASDADWQAIGDWVVTHRYQLSPAVTPERYTAAGLRDAIDETLSLLGTPAGNALKPLLARDPTGETQRIAESLIAPSMPRSEQGVWVARTAPRALLLATTRAAGADLDAQSAAIALARSAFDALSALTAPATPASSATPATPASPQLRLLASGPGVFAAQSRAQIEREVRLLAIVGSVVMGSLLLLAFASLRALAVAMLPVATGIVAGIVAVSLTFGAVHGITLGFGSTLIGEAVDYAIYFLIQARGAPASAPLGPAGDGPPVVRGWLRWRDENWPTVRLGLLTSVCGFAALAFSGFPGLAQLGVFSVAGLTGAALATRYVLPVLMPDGASGRGVLRTPLGRLAAEGVRVLPRLRVPFLVLAALAVASLALQGGPLWRANLGSLSPVPLAAQQLDALLRADLGASDAGTLVVANGRDRQAALRAAEAAGQRLDALVEQGLLAGYETPVRLLPSVAAQQRRLASLPEREALLARLAEATAGGPLAPGRLAPFVDEVQAARTVAPIERAALDGLPITPAIDALLFARRAGGYSALMPLRPTPASGGLGSDAASGAPRSDAAPGVLDAARVRTALQGLSPTHDIQVVDIGPELASLYRGYLHEAFVQVALGAFAVVALLALYLRSARRLVTVCQPLAIAVLLTLAGLSLAGVALGILHLVGLLLVVAVGSNYTLFFDQLRRQGQVDEDTLASLLLANLTTVISFGLIALSEIPALSAIGRVVAPGALLALLLAAAFARREGAARER